MCRMTLPGPDAPEPFTPAAAERPRRGGLVALILGIVALVAALIPFLSYIAGFIAIAAVIVGILALRGALRKGRAITGIVLGAIALLTAIVMSIIYSVIFFVIPAAVRSIPSTLPSGFPSSLPTDLPTPSALGSAPATGAGGSVVFRVTGGSEASSINYTAADSGGAATAQVADADLPWSKSVGIESGTAFASYALVAQNAGTGDITCSITVNGREVSTKTSSGRYSVVSCSATQQ